MLQIARFAIGPRTMAKTWATCKLRLNELIAIVVVGGIVWVRRWGPVDPERVIDSLEMIVKTHGRAVGVSVALTSHMAKGTLGQLAFLVGLAATAGAAGCLLSQEEVATDDDEVVAGSDVTQVLKSTLILDQGC